MTKNNLKNQLKLLTDNFDLDSTKKFKLIVFVGLLGDFDSFEYAINLGKILKSDKANELDVSFIAIGNEKGKEKFCKYTQFPQENLKIVCDNKYHNLLGVSRGLETGLGGWINITLMLLGIGSPRTLQEVFRGYTGDKGSRQIYTDKDQINLFNIFKFSGKLFRNSFGNGYLRPMELATFRLENMIEIFKNWRYYMINTKYLPQRTCTLILNQNNEIKYKYFSKDILSYSYNMRSPLNFLSDFIDT